MIVPLIEAGANPQGKNEQGYTPLRIARQEYPAHISEALGIIELSGRSAVIKALPTSVSPKEISSSDVSLEKLIATKLDKIKLCLPNANEDELAGLIVESYSRVKKNNQQ